MSIFLLFYNPRKEPARSCYNVARDSCFLWINKGWMFFFMTWSVRGFLYIREVNSWPRSSSLCHNFKKKGWCVSPRDSLFVSFQNIFLNVDNYRVGFLNIFSWVWNECFFPIVSRAMVKSVKEVIKQLNSSIFLLGQFQILLVQG